jgi:hypothetical protein
MFLPWRLRDSLGGVLLSFRARGVLGCPGVRTVQWHTTSIEVRHAFIKVKILNVYYEDKLKLQAFISQYEIYVRLSEGNTDGQ